MVIGYFRKIKLFRWSRMTSGSTTDTPFREHIKHRPPHLYTPTSITPRADRSEYGSAGSNASSDAATAAGLTDPLRPVTIIILHELHLPTLSLGRSRRTVHSPRRHIQPYQYSPASGSDPSLSRETSLLWGLVTLTQRKRERGGH
jgi:hypothetical protein